MSACYHRLNYLARMEDEIAPVVITNLTQVVFQPILQETKCVQTVLQKVENTVEGV